MCLSGMSGTSAAGSDKVPALSLCCAVGVALRDAGVKRRDESQTTCWMFLGPDGPGGFHLGPDEAVNSVQWLLFSRPGIGAGVFFF